MLYEPALMECEMEQHSDVDMMLKYNQRKERREQV